MGRKDRNSNEHSSAFGFDSRRTRNARKTKSTEVIAIMVKIIIIIVIVTIMVINHSDYETQQRQR